MPVVKLYQNGLTAGCPPRHVNRKPVPRGDCKGWSLRTSRGNTRFLYSVVSADLPVSADDPPRPLLGLSGSLTVGDCPLTHEDWKKVREAFLLRQRRRGLYRLHWLTEWQKRGVPHLHFAAWFLQPESEYEAAILPALVKADWLQLTAPYRSSGKGQEIKPITDEVGWLQYLSKHASRGAAHYQRAMSTIPKGWQKTGRMWGHLGDFPTREPQGLELDDRGWFKFRRIVRGWRLAQARILIRHPASKPVERRHLDEQTRRRRIKSARRMLQCRISADPTVLERLSRCRGVSEWIPFTSGESIGKFLENPSRDSIAAWRRFLSFERSLAWLRSR